MIKKYKGVVGETIYANNISAAKAYQEVGRKLLIEQRMLPDDYPVTSTIVYIEDSEETSTSYSCKQVLSSEGDINLIAIPTINIDSELLEKLVTER